MIHRFLGVWAALLLAGFARGETLPASGWEGWAPRADLRPEFATDKEVHRGDGESMRIRTKRASDFGAWQRVVTELKPGQAYRFRAWYRAEGVANEKRAVIPRLEWLDGKGNMTRPPEYALPAGGGGEWQQVELVTTAPEKASAVQVQLGFGFAKEGTIWWDGVSLEPVSELPERTVRAVTVFHRPRGTKSAAESVEQFCQLARRSAEQRPDVICLPEGITVVGTGLSYWEVGEIVPGPTTARLGALARELHSHVVAGIYERVDDLLYNTAVMIGRDGKLMGTYRKTHLPREEWEAGITPGDSYPVFQTDFGKVGLMICWDVQFPEPARAMALRGAEVLLLPIWGGNETLAKARAIENHVFLVSSSYDMKTFIVDPVGAVLAEATLENPVAMAELPLGRKYYQPWLGDMKQRTWKERRPDIQVELE